MKKLILLLTIIVFVLIGCADINMKKHIIIITQIYKFDDSPFCHYYTNRIDFIDSCNKYQIGDTIQIVKKQ